MSVVTNIADGTFVDTNNEIRGLAKSTIRLSVSTKFDTLLDTYIQQAVGFLEGDNGELLTQRVVTEKHDYIRMGDLILQYAPVAAVTKFSTYSYTGQLADAPADTSLFTLNGNTLFVKRDTCPPNANSKIEIQYTAGFATLSADYKAGIASAVALLFESGGTNLVNTMGYRKRFIVC